MCAMQEWKVTNVICFLCGRSNKQEASIVFAARLGFSVASTRWDHDGSFDVLVVGHGEKSAKPVVIAGDTLSIRGERDLPH